MITFAALRDLSTTSIGPASDDYHSAGNKLHTAASDYRSRVVAPIDSRHIWRGVGRSHAETVARVERLALATAGARMRIVGTTLETLQAELAAAKIDLHRVIDDAAVHDYSVDDTGTVKPGPTHKSMTVPSIGGVDPAQAWGDQEAARYEARMKLAVRRAQRADKACGQLLDTVTGASFVTTTTAQPGILAKAKEAYYAAHGGELYANLLHKLLLAAHRQDSHATDHKEYGYPDHGIGVGKGLWDWGSGTVRDLIGIIGLIGLAASGDPSARAALKAIPSSTWKQLSTAQGWGNLAKEVFDWRDLKGGRPGEFLGNNLAWFISYLGITKTTKILRATKWMLKNPHTGRLIDVEKTSQSIAGHSYDKHVVEKKEFPGVHTRGQLKSLAEDVITKGTMKKLNGGRLAFWRKGTLVIYNPAQKDGSLGTIFRPDDGKAYFEDLD